MAIFLLGFMGSGKSTLGKVLAVQLGRDFVDLDHYIEEKENNSVSTIFAQQGEAHFRQLETAYLKELIRNNDNAVISLGGGTPCYNNNMELANASGKTVYLRMSPEDLFQRLVNQKDHRPLLQGKTDEELKEFIRTKLLEREQHYLKANVVLDNSGTALEMVELLASGL